jgi:four helix bundle protein
MGKVERFEELRCWQEARILVRSVYEVCNQGKLAKDFGMKDQLSRAALSTMNNIAEGFGRYYDKEFIRFLNIAQSSACEVKSMLYILEDIKYLNEEELKDLHSKIDKMRNSTLALIKYISGKLKTEKV